MIIGLISALTRGLWAIEPSAAEGFLPLVNNIILGKDLPKEQLQINEEEHSSYAVTKTGGMVARHSSFDSAPQGSVALIPITGPIMKYNGLCSYGSIARGNQVREADAHPNIIGTILEFDSPGGMVAGSQTFSDIVSNTKKPVVAFVNDGILASAAYWMASGANEIISSHSIDMIGSIGVYVTLADWKGYYESEGLKILDIYAEQSTEKNHAFKEAVKGNEKPVKLEFLNPTVDKFISTVKKNRADQLNPSAGDPFKGKLYMAPEALEIGLIDGIGNIEYAIERVQSLSKEAESNTQSNFKVTVS